MTTKHAIKAFIEGNTIGHADLTAQEFTEYQALAQQPGGLIRLEQMPSGFCQLAAEFHDTYPSTTVYLA